MIKNDRTKSLTSGVAFGICVLVAGLLNAAPVAGPAGAPAAPAAPSKAPARVAVVDTSRVFNEMQETQDFKAKLATERQKLQAEEAERKGNIKKLQDSRSLYKPGSPDMDKLNEDILQEGIKLEIWGKYAGAQAERNQKKLLKTLFEKIEESTTDYAQQEGFDLVLVKQMPELPDNLEGITFDQLRSLINQRDVLFASAKIDITSAVLAKVDAKYRSGGGITLPKSGAAPAPGAGPASGTAEKSRPATPDSGTAAPQDK